VYAFICSAGHSGSTLLDILLGSHLRGFSLGEITHLPKNIALNSQCSCGRQIDECLFWKPLLSDYGHEKGTDFWSHPYSLDLGYIKATDEVDHRQQTSARMFKRKVAYTLLYAWLRYRLPGRSVVGAASLRAACSKVDLFDFILERTGCDFVVDSSKHYLEAASLYRVSPTKTKLILLVRDGRAVFFSGLRRGVPPATAIDSWASHWRRALDVFDAAVPDADRLVVRYEDIVTSTGNSLQRIFEFIGVDPAGYTAPSVSGDRHIVNGNRMRFVSPLAVVADEKWRRELSTPMRELFESKAGDLNEALGYG
jgi:hypothetical protein